MSRYVGTGVGAWRGPWYVYRPSTDDRLAAREAGERIARRRAAAIRDGYGATSEARPEWIATGFLGEMAALHPLRSGPELETYSGRGWQGRADFGPLEIRTTSSRQLYGFALSPRYGPGLGGWRVVRKDAGRYIVCVEDRGDDFAVQGWARADDIPRLGKPLGRILAVIEPPDLRPLEDLAPYSDIVRAIVKS